MSNHAHLPADWVDRLFGRLAVRYGAQWLRMWEGLDMASVKADWAEELAGLHAPEKLFRLKYALEYLPAAFPPNAREFRDLCRQAPMQEPLLQLPAPTEDMRDRLVDLRDRLHGLGSGPKDPRAWAHRLIERHESGAHIATPTAIAMARCALKAGPRDMGVMDA